MKGKERYLSASEVRNEYFQWLCDVIYINQEEHSYWFLAKALHKKEYFWTVPNDDNRGMEGKKLRNLFASELGYHPKDFLERPCTMLELIVGLAKRFEDSMLDTSGEDRIARWFWELMENCGLDKYTDEAYIDLDGPIKVDEILNKILERTYKRDGRGGLFPLKESKKDQRKVEMWYQMCSYLLENYYNKGKNV